MYLYYLLTAYSVILLTALISYLMMKKAEQNMKKSNINRALCTVLAMVCATLSPLLANLLVKELYFSITLSLLLSFIFLIVLASGVFILVQSALAKQESKNPVALPDDLHKESEEDTPVENIGLEEAAAAHLPVHREQNPVPEEANPEQTAKGEEAVVLKESVQSNIEAYYGYVVPEAVTEEKEISRPILPSLVEQALENKNNHHYFEAISLYEQAINQETDLKLREWMVIDLCALYKMTNQKEFVNKILEFEDGILQNLEIKEAILRNL